MWPVFAVSGRHKLEEEKRDEHELGGHSELLLIFVVLMRFGIVGSVYILLKTH
jgi:hypothetical protein